MEILIAMPTVDRQIALPGHPRENYLGETIRALLEQSVSCEAIHLFPTHTDIDWLTDEGVSIYDVTLHLPDRHLTGLQNELRALTVPPCDWVLFLEDDLEFCADFFGSVQRWLTKAVKHNPDAHVFSFHTPWTPEGLKPTKKWWPYPCLESSGTQAFAIRWHEAQALYGWGHWQLRQKMKPETGFDTVLKKWHRDTWPDVAFVASNPCFVQHIGAESSLFVERKVLPRKNMLRTNTTFRGREWRYA